MSSDGITLAHGIGGTQDLPISVPLAVAGAIAALTISFTVLAVSWRVSRYDAETSGRPAPAWLEQVVGSTVFVVLLRVFGMLVFGYTAAVAVLGKDLLTNPVFGIFYVWLWVGLVPLSVLFGPVYRAISPVRTINLVFAKLSGSDPDRGIMEYPARLGYWPAAIGLFAFVWIELVYPFSTQLGPVRLWCAVYVALMLLGGALFGSSFYHRGDPFEVYSTLVGKLSVWGRRQGRLVVRSPLANLDTTQARPGLIAVVAILFGSTGFDSFSDSAVWVRFTQESTASIFLLDFVALVVFCAGVGGLLAAGCVITGAVADAERRSLPDRFAHSVVPIIVGYVVAHYLTYLVEYGQETLILASDPLGEGSNLLGTGDWQVNYWLSFHPTLLASVQVAAVLVGHLLGVISAHDRALQVLPMRDQIVGQLPLLFVMLVFTGGGLTLLLTA